LVNEYGMCGLAHCLKRPIGRLDAMDFRATHSRDEAETITKVGRSNFANAGERSTPNKSATSIASPIAVGVFNASAQVIELIRRQRPLDDHVHHAACGDGGDFGPHASRNLDSKWRSRLRAFPQPAHLF
jgi:hypothetical protein